VAHPGQPVHRAMTEALLPPLQRSLLFAGALFLTGVVTWRGAIVPRLRFELSGGDLHLKAELPPVAALERRVCRLAAWASLSLLVVWGLRLWSQMMDFRDPFAPLAEDLRFLVRDTFWGTVWLGQGVLLVCLSAAFLLLARRAGSTPPPPPGLTPEGVPRQTPPAVELPLRWKAQALGVFFLLLTLGLSSHAMSVPANRPLAVSVDVAHAAAAGAWMGSLAVILTANGTGAGGHRVLAAQLRAFSPVAMVAVGVLLFMGILLSSFHLHEIPALWESRYGRTLSAKIMAAGAVLAVGLWNWRRGLPSLAASSAESDPGDPAPRAMARVGRSAWMEVALAALVVALTAVLVATPVPPGAH